MYKSPPRREYITNTPLLNTAKLFQDVEGLNVTGIMEYIDAAGDPHARMKGDGLSDEGVSFLCAFSFYFAKNEKDFAAVVAKLILERGLSVDTKFCEGKHLIEVAVEFQSDYLFSVLLQNKVNVKGFKDNTLLLRPVIQNYPSRVQALLELGANPNDPTLGGKSILSFAARNGNVDVVSILLKHKADPNLHDASLECNPLFVSIQCGRKRIAEMLVKAGADVNTVRSGRTPLNLAADYSRVSEMEMLIEAGANVNHANEELMTALHVAARSASTEPCRVLLDRGADIDAKNKSGATPLHIALQCNRSEVVEFLMLRGADAEQVFPEHKCTAWVYAEKHSPTMYYMMKRAVGQLERARENINKTKSK